MIVDSSSTSTALSYHMSAIEDHHAISSFSRLGFLHLLPSAASASLDHQEELGMDTTTQWPQGLALGKAMEEFGSSAATLRPETAEIMKAGRPPRKEQPLLKCPRCNSGNTKFCYYNNYSLTQPRYFCKACRRYWTEGGSLRNVPVGGGSRKYKKSSSSSSPSSSSSAAATAISAPGKSPVGYVNLSATTSRIPRQYMLPVEYNYINSHCSNFTPFSPMMPASSASTEFLSGFGAQELIRPAPAISFPMDGDFSAASYGPMAEEMKLAVVPSSGIHVAHQLFEENNNNRQRDELPPPAGFWSVVMNNNAGGSW